MFFALLPVAFEPSIFLKSVVDAFRPFVDLWPLILVFITMSIILKFLRYALDSRFSVDDEIDDSADVKLNGIDYRGK